MRVLEIFLNLLHNRLFNYICLVFGIVLLIWDFSIGNGGSHYTIRSAAGAFLLGLTLPVLLYRLKNSHSGMKN